MASDFGLISGLGSNGLVGGDSTNIPLQIRAIMAKRKAEKKDDTPVWNKEDALKAINEKYKGMDDKTRDSIANTFNHKAYLEHLDNIGMQVVPKPKQ